ncbi:hypothetical protein M3194_27900 [Paenibacillus glycanilyticus]|uniref:hypothetical protein n=1 Tax=Paenibacillus glycanilyticus TaxID=126569 RepID=UPI0020422778|nr:hypothetical protein [Paenibacillus glycanilyticus]MCM3631141.1 hypothetical protein [Paenibacillus glycanilyticus]
MPITELRYIFSDYNLADLHVPPWKQYSIHIHESSLRTVDLVEQKMIHLLGGGTYTRNQVWVDLQGVYGFADGVGSINALGHDFLAFAATAPNSFSKELWIYREHSRATSDTLKSTFVRRNNNLHIFLKHISGQYSRKLFDGSYESDKALAFAEHLIPFPKSITRLFHLSWAQIVSLTNRSDTNIDSLISRLHPTHDNLLISLLTRIKTYNREESRRRIAITSIMLIPIIERINARGYSPSNVVYPFNKFFNVQEVNIQLQSLGYTIY